MNARIAMDAAGPISIKNHARHSIGRFRNVKTEREKAAEKKKYLAENLPRVGEVIGVRLIPLRVTQVLRRNRLILKLDESWRQRDEM